MVSVSLDHVHLRCADLERTLRFYASLGLRIGRIPWGKGEYVFVGLDRGAIDPTPALGPGDRSPITIGLAVDDLDEAYRRARAAGAEILEAPRDQPWGVRNFYVRDPDGHQLEFFKEVAGPPPPGPRASNATQT